MRYFQYGSGAKKICFVVGIHGIENTSIQMAFELIEFLKNSNLDGEVRIVPLANLARVIREIRENPEDGKDINASFINRSPVSSSEKIAQYVWNIVKEYEWIVDLHLTGYARYLPHVIIFDDKVIEDVKYFGFPFIIKRKTGKSGEKKYLTCFYHSTG